MNAVTAALNGIGIDPGGPVPVPERITSKNLTYDQIVDEVLLSPPGETQGALARRIGYTQSWLSTLISSDAFQAKLAERIEKHIEPERREMFRLRFASIEEEAKAILHRSLSILKERLYDPAGVPDQLVVKSVETTSRLLGYGARNEPAAPQVNLNIHIQELADNLRNLNRAPDVSVVATQPAGPPAIATAVSEVSK